MTSYDKVILWMTPNCCHFHRKTVFKVFSEMVESLSGQGSVVLLVLEGSIVTKEISRFY